MSVIQNHEAQVRFSDAKKEYITYSAIRKHISFRKNLKILKFPILKYFFIECVQIKLYLRICRDLLKTFLMENLMGKFSFLRSKGQQK